MAFVGSLGGSTRTCCSGKVPLRVGGGCDPHLFDSQNPILEARAPVRSGCRGSVCSGRSVSVVEPAGESLELTDVPLAVRARQAGRCRRDAVVFTNQLLATPRTRGPASTCVLSGIR